MKKSVLNLVKHCKSYTVGDLFEALAILEMCDELKKDTTVSAELRILANNIYENVEEAINDGPSGENELKAREYFAQLYQISGAEENLYSQNKHIITVDDGEVLYSFVTETFQHLDDIETDIMNLDKNFDMELLNSVFRAIHTVKGTASFIGLQQITKLSHELETLLDNIRDSRISYSDKVTDVLLEGSDLIIKMVMELKPYAENNKSVTEAFSVELTEYNYSELEKKIKNLLLGCSGNLLTSLEEKCKNLEESLEGLSNPDHRLIIHDFLDNVKGFCKEVDPKTINEKKDHTQYKGMLLGEILVEHGVCRSDVEAALELQNCKLGEILVKQKKIDQPLLDRVLSLQGSQDQTDSTISLRTGSTVVKIDTSKLDELFNIIGEIITAQSMLANSRDLKGLNLPDFSKSANHLMKVTREAQEITMQMRMIPLDSLFTKMQRLIRDLSKKFGKDIDVEVSGQDTEMDRNIIDKIADPLVHIIRNAVDHGIESASERQKNNKPIKGKVELKAGYEGREIWIRIKDDGKGLDSSAIRKKAIALDLIREDEKISDEKLWDFIFEPGFSTSEVISDVSGRGVGMDVVKRNIEKLRGRIDITSEKGKGTEFIIKIPLTLAILEGITVRVGQMIFSIPTEDIVEFINADERQLTSTEFQDVLNVRGDIYPVIKMGEFFGAYKKEKTKSEIDQMLSVIVKSNSKKAALFVDEIIGTRQLVIKTLPAILGDKRGITGCSLMGDGNVSLIVDTNELLSEILL
ncbi:MAG: chemotaxis protein CheA [Spirochaetales bacterium]|nr:chemotaxis protein CheA [Spirochaetales bacterium]